MNRLDMTQNQNGISIRFQAEIQAKNFSIEFGPCHQNVRHLAREELEHLLGGDAAALEVRD